VSTKPWTGAEGPVQPGPAGLLDILRRRGAKPRVELPGAVLFDMDGLLIDSEPLWTIAEQRVSEILGGVFTPELKARMIGKRLDLAVGILLEGLGTPAAAASDPTEIGRLLLAETASLFAAGVPLQPGALELLDLLEQARVPLALVSSSYRQLVDAALKTVGAHRFDVTIAGDEVAHGKPDPEPYLTAAKALTVVPARCVVLEDAPSGLQSAVAAGCACVYVPTFAPDDGDPALPPRVEMRASLREVDLALLGRLSVHPESLGARSAGRRPPTS
jgi:HAD superfamily hydrolase (TIGR01509 family)